MLKLAALGALGYAGYKYYQNNVMRGADRDTIAPRNKVAGGPLSEEAQISPTAGPHADELSEKS